MNDQIAIKITFIRKDEIKKMNNYLIRLYDTQIKAKSNFIKIHSLLHL